MKLLLLLLGIINSLYGAYALSLLWAWFIVSTFKLPTISIPVAWGMILTAQMLRMGLSVKIMQGFGTEETAKARVTKSLEFQIYYMVMTSVTLLIAFIVQFFI